MDDLMAEVSALLATSGDRDRRILTARLGLDGRPPHSLELLGAELAISRERVRQIEQRVLEDIAARLPAPSIEARLAARGDEAWRAISHGEGYLRRADLMLRRHDLPVDVRLLLVLARLPLAAWLHHVARAYGSGWCDRAIGVRRLNSVAKRLAQRVERRPHAIITGLGEDLDPLAVRIVLALALDRSPRSRRPASVRGRNRG